MLFLTRGHGVERSRGLLLVQKLDFLQLLAVEWVRDAAAAVGRRAVWALSDLSDAWARLVARRCPETRAKPPAEGSAAAPAPARNGCAVRLRAPQHRSLMFGKPLVNNVLKLDHAQK